MRYDVFISYSSIDQKIAEGVCAYLEQQEIRCFVAYRDIPRGLEWAEVIVEALEHSRMMVVLFSNNFNNSKQVNREIELASNSNMPILTFRLTDDDFEGAKKYYLQNLNWIDAFPNPERSFGALYGNVSSLLGIAVPDNEVKKEVSESRGSKSSNLYLWIVIACLSVALVVMLIFSIPKDNINNKQADLVEYTKTGNEKVSKAELDEINNQGDKEYKNGNYSEAVKLFKKAAEQGHDKAQINLGWCYENGSGVSKNYSNYLLKNVFLLAKRLSSSFLEKMFYFEY